jgi:ribosomal 50S subunit-recycling heat shock protein
VRLDLFLKTSRLVKRRTVARELCETGRVLVGGQEAKPAKEVKPGDRLTIKHPSRTVVLEILELPRAAKKAAVEQFYRIVSETRVPGENDR